MSDKEGMDTDTVLDGLTRALGLQHRSILQFEVTSASLFQVDHLLRARRRD